MTDVKKIIAPRLRALREQKKWVIREAAKAIGVGATAYGNWEQGIRAPRYAEVEKAAQVYGVTPEYLVGWAQHVDDTAPFVCAGKNKVTTGDQTITIASPCRDSALSQEYLRKHGLQENHLLATFAPDDAMTGDIEKGDEIVINMADTVPAYTHIFAIVVKGNIWLRRIRPGTDNTYTMEANEKSIQPDENISLDAIHILGRVVRVCRNL